MSGYTKLFSSIIGSTIWREDADTRLVWITMLAMANKDGVVEASVPGLADFARVSVDGVRRALVKLASPDPDSRTEDHEGRRICDVEGGWLLLNHAKYRAKMSEAERKEYKRRKQAEYRRRGVGVDTALTGVDNCGQALNNVDAVDTSRSRSRTQKQETPTVSVHTAALGSRSEHRSHAHCGRACLPAFLYREFVQLRGGAEDHARREVDAWAYALIKAISDDGERATEVIGDPLKWWRAQWEAAHPTTKPDTRKAEQDRVLAEVMAMGPTQRSAS